MGFEPTTRRDLVGFFNYWATGGSMASKGEMYHVLLLQKTHLGVRWLYALMWLRDAVISHTYLSYLKNVKNSNAF